MRWMIAMLLMLMPLVAADLSVSRQLDSSNYTGMNVHYGLTGGTFEGATYTGRFTTTHQQGSTDRIDVASFDGDIGHFPQLLEDSSAPVIGPITVTPTNDTADVSFATDDAANVTFELGLTPALGTVLTDPSFLQNHLLALAPLLPNTTYYYNITVCNIWSICTEAGVYNFTTLPTPISPPATPSSDTRAWRRGDFHYCNLETGVCYSREEIEGRPLAQRDSLFSLFNLEPTTELAQNIDDISVTVGEAGRSIGIPAYLTIIGVAAGLFLLIIFGIRKWFFAGRRRAPDVPIIGKE